MELTSTQTTTMSDLDGTVSILIVGSDKMISRFIVEHRSLLPKRMCNGNRDMLHSLLYVALLLPFIFMPSDKWTIAPAGDDKIYMKIGGAYTTVMRGSVVAEPEPEPMKWKLTSLCGKDTYM